VTDSPGAFPLTSPERFQLAGLLVALAVGGVAVLLTAWQLVERSHRETGMEPEDARYFSGQDRRRAWVALVLILLAAGIYSGSHTEHVVNRRPNPTFLAVWIGVFGLVLTMIALALGDWLATRRYGLRHRKAMIREGLEILRDEMAYRMRGSGGSDEAGGINGRTPG
jgi:hypothetical protein